jgi:hypothetical protein
MKIKPKLFRHKLLVQLSCPTLTHPQVSGKPQVILMHERIIEYIKSHEGVELVTMEQMVYDSKSGKLPGVSIEGGV